MLRYSILPDPLRKKIPDPKDAILPNVSSDEPFTDFCSEKNDVFGAVIPHNQSIFPKEYLEELEPSFRDGNDEKYILNFDKFTKTDPEETSIGDILKKRGEYGMTLRFRTNSTVALRNIKTFLYVSDRKYRLFAVAWHGSNH